MLSLFQYQDIHYHLVAQLYSKDELSDSNELNTTEQKFQIDATSTLNKAKVSTFRLNIIWFFSNIFPCCIRPNKEERYFIRGLKEFRAELDVIEFMRSRINTKKLLQQICSEKGDQVKRISRLIRK